MALDTKSGQECVTMPKSEPIEKGDYPYCYDLYKSE